MTFTGIPLAAVTFYRELEADNSREWWLANKKRYDELVREPFVALAEELTPPFGESKVYRPYRDMRFSTDKTPYKNHQGLYARSSATTGWYFQIGADGFMAGGGSYYLAGDQLARYRSAVANDASGVQLEAILTELVEAGYVIGGEQLATRPRGVAADAPRLDLLRRKSLSAMLDLGEPEWMATSEAVEYLNDAWDEVRSLISWLDQFVGESTLPRR